MPDLYASGDYDFVGFSVGVVESKRLVDGKNIAEEDVVIGLASSGFHSNGFTLIRKVVFEMAGLSVEQEVPELQQTVGEALLTPTLIYAQPLRHVFQHYPVKGVIHGIAHITGGGLRENLERILPQEMQLILDRDSWPVPAVFPWLQRLGSIEQAEMERVFNLGIGMALVVSPYYASSISEQLTDSGAENWIIGKAVQGPRGVVW